MIDNISVVIMAKNAEDTIEECLNSLTLFKEVVLYLNSSTDGTNDIALNFNNVKIINGEFIGFGKTKNKAASYSSNDWILSLDSDEILNQKLLNNIIKEDYSQISTVFILKRDNYFLGAKTISKDSIVRIYNRMHTQFNDNMVHEKVIVKNSTNKVKIKHSFKHLNIIDINQTLTKMMQYTDLGSSDKKMCFFIIVILKSFFAFIQTYFFRFYFINGWRGFTIAITNANRRFYKYLKQYINCKGK